LTSYIPGGNNERANGSVIVVCNGAQREGIGAKVGEKRKKGLTISMAVSLPREQVQVGGEATWLPSQVTGRG
jgi:hypothetical protein